MAVNYKPEGHQNVIPYLLNEGAGKVLEFLKQTFGAVENSRMTGEGGRIDHAHVTIGDSVVMLAEARPEWPASPSQMYVYVEDTDAVYRRGLEAGGASVMEPADQFYGDRNAGLKDPAGNTWWIATHIEEVTDEEMQRRAAERKK